MSYRRSQVALIAVSLFASSLALVGVTRVRAEEQAPKGIKVGYGEADATWHVGAGAGQYTQKDPDSATWVGGGSVDPHNHSVAQRNSYGVQSRLSFRSIIVQDAEGDQVAFVKSDNYLAMDYLARRAGQILAEAGSTISYEEIFHMATHNHSSPMYSTPSWGVWLFQDAFDLRAFEYQARAMAQSILNAEDALQPARMGATTVKHKLFKGVIQRRRTADDGSPAGYPLDFGDFGLPVIRFDTLAGDPIAVLMNWGQHPEGLDDADLISGDYVAPLERFVERATGAPLVFGQGDVGSAEAGPGNPDLVPKGIPRRWSHAGHAQAERGAYLLSRDVIRAYEEIATGDPQVPFDDDFDVAAGNAWVPGPLSHPYPSVSNCRTEPTVEGNPGAPVAGLPDCERAGDSDDRASMVWELLKEEGIPVPEHYDASAFTGVEENLRLHLQAFKLGEVILMSCACEAQVDLILNLESRTDDVASNIWDGYDWTKRLDCTQATPPDGDWTCTPKPGDPPQISFGGPLTFSDAAYDRMLAQVHNNAKGWDNPENAVAANSEPADASKIWGNFTQEELSPDLGYTLPIGVGHASDYNGYTVSYREYMSYDDYRKALTSYGPHTADYMATTLVELARELNDGDDDDTYDFRPYDEPRYLADEQRQEAVATALGAASGRAYDAWRSALPNDVGPAAPLAQPESIRRFDAATFSWRGGSNAVDNPTVKVQRLVDGQWTDFADQTGEIQTKLKFPEGVNGFADTYAGAQEWVWTAGFEAFDAFPAEIGSTPVGEYRFVIDGLIRQAGADAPYHLESDSFTVSPWNGLEVADLKAEPNGSVSFTVSSGYPQTYESAFPYVSVQMLGEAGEDAVNDPFCATCSFRPWATSGTVRSATVTVVRADGSTQLVPAQLSDGRWIAKTNLGPGDSAFVAAGDVVDNYGEVNSNASTQIAG